MLKLSLLSLLLLSGCAATGRNHPDYIRAQEQKKAQRQSLIKQIKIVKTEPDQCEYLKAVQADGIGANLRPDYETALFMVKGDTVDAGGNTLVIDAVTDAHRVSGRAFRCP